MHESAVSQRLQLKCANLGVMVQRNNVGAMQDASGRMVRFGLMNETAAINKIVKSSDFICVQPVTITPDMIGQRIGVYVSLEAKKSDWRLTPGDAHGQAQAAYHRLVIAHGGRAGFVTCDADVRRILMVG